MNDGADRGGEIRPCLIGGFRVKIDTREETRLLPERTGGVPRHEPYAAPDGSVYSLDMVRLAIRFEKDDGHVARFEDWLMRLDTLQETYTMARSRAGRYAHLYTFGYGDSTVTLGVGQFVKGVKADMHRGFVEFNPNKVAGSHAFDDFIQHVGEWVTRCSLVRYDLAVDIPVTRGCVRTRKDRRRYSFVQGSALTENLGVRNSDGYVKVYDKAAELGVKGMKLTRVELTCSGEWGVDAVLRRWPTVYVTRARSGDDSDVNVALAMMAVELQDHGESPEKYLGHLNKHRRAKVRRLMEGARFPCSEIGAAWVWVQANNWAEKLNGTDGQGTIKAQVNG